MTITKDNLTRRYTQSLLILFSFFVIALFVTLPFWQTHRLIVISDFSFHASRVEEISNNLKQGKIFTFIASKTFNSTGVGSFLFYPTYLLYPWACLRIIFNPINAFYLWYMLLTFVALIIAFYSMYSFSENKVQSYLFALIYVFAPYRLYLGTSVFGEFIAVTFIPIIFLGFYQILWGDTNRWWVLSIGLALVAYSHILSTIISLEYLFIIFVLYFIYSKFKIGREKLVALSKSAILTLGLVAFELVPFIQSYIGRNIFSASQGISYGLSFDFNRLLNCSISNVLGFNSIGFILITGLCLSFLFINKTEDKCIYLLGLSSCILATTAFPWHLFDSTPLTIIQMPYRYLPYAILFLSVITSKLIASLFIKRKIQLGILTIITLSLFTIIYTNSVKNNSLQALKATKTLLVKNTDKNAKLMPGWTAVDKAHYNNIFSYGVKFGEYDYYPQSAHGNSNEISPKAVSIDNHLLLKENKQVRVFPRSYPNLIRYSIRGKGKVDLPVIAYNGTFVKVNGKVTKLSISNRGTVLVKLKNKGTNIIDIGYKISPVYYVLMIIAVALWVLVIYMGIFKQHFKDSNL